MKGNTRDLCSDCRMLKALCRGKKFRDQIERYLMEIGFEPLRCFMRIDPWTLVPRLLGHDDVFQAAHRPSKMATAPVRQGCLLFLTRFTNATPHVHRPFNMDPHH